MHYGHKLNLATGRSGLIFDLVIEAGNPADAERFIPMLERHIAANGTPPRQTTSDGGYASLDNLNQAKAMGVRDVAFKKRGLSLESMVKSHWVYRKLRNFQAGIEANISCLKRVFGLARLHMARIGSLQGLCLVIGRGLQSCTLRKARPALNRAI